MATPYAFASRSDLFDRWSRLESAIDDTDLDPVLITWCRVRARVLFGASPPQSSIEPPAPDIEEFAEQFWMDAHGISDALAERVRLLLGDGPTVALVVLLGLSEVDVRTELMFA
ncbi:MAG: hypothetical protein JWP07_679 [Pseudonocardiales bacterium]|nr:hypothetical protein [Pseudonocardiales bacterium]